VQFSGMTIFPPGGPGGRRQTGMPEVAMPRNCHLF